MAPLISVIMPCHNAAPHLREAVQSVFDQHHHNTELVVVDDGSDDGSTELLARLQREHPERLRVFHQSQQGAYPARNRGLRQARGEYIAFLDADDWWDPGFLSSMLAALQRHGADLAYCGWQHVGERAADTDPYLPPEYTPEEMPEAFLRGCPWPIHAALTRREAIDAVGGFSERRRSSMDYDLWIRIMAHTRRLVRVPQVLAFYRWHGATQISATRWRQVLDAMDVRRRYVAEHPDQVRHLSPQRLHELVEGPLLQEAYRAYWRRDLDNARPLFRIALRRGHWRARDLRHLLPALLPAPLYRRLIQTADRHRAPEAP